MIGELHLAILHAMPVVSASGFAIGNHVGEKYSPRSGVSVIGHGRTR